MLMKDSKMFKLVTEQYLNAVSCCYFKVFNLLMIRRSKYELCSCTCFVTFVGLTGTYKLLFTTTMFTRLNPSIVMETTLVYKATQHSHRIIVNVF